MTHLPQTHLQKTLPYPQRWVSPGRLRCCPGVHLVRTKAALPHLPPPPPGWVRGSNMRTELAKPVSVPRGSPGAGPRAWLPPGRWGDQCLWGLSHESGHIRRCSEPMSGWAGSRIALSVPSCAPVPSAQAHWLASLFCCLPPLWPHLPAKMKRNQTSCAAGDHPAIFPAAFTVWGAHLPLSTPSI